MKNECYIHFFPRIPGFFQKRIPKADGCKQNTRELKYFFPPKIILLIFLISFFQYIFQVNIKILTIYAPLKQILSLAFSGSASSVRLAVITTASSSEYASISTNSFFSFNKVCSWNFLAISSLEWTGKYSILTYFLEGMILISADTRNPRVP